MPLKELNSKVLTDWKDLAAAFRTLLGGSETGMQAADYLIALATNRLPLGDLHPFTWHRQNNPAQVVLQARQEPHPVVLATLVPSVPLRAVWRRRR